MVNGRNAVFMQNEALHIVILLNKSQDCELKLFRIFLTLFSIRLANMNLRLESESASRRKFTQLVDGCQGSNGRMDFRVTP